MDKNKNISKSLISPPGDTLKEHLEFIGMEEGELAERMNLPKETIDDLICGQEPIRDEIAANLESVLHIPATFWQNREKAYRKELSNCGVGV